MIPSEILKNIRQTETRTNRIVTKTRSTYDRRRGSAFGR
jgi:hypothetical protein